MVTGKYQYSYTKLLANYQKSKDNVSINYQKDRISEQFIQHLLEDWLREAITHPYHQQRIHAVEKIGQYGRGSLELHILQRISSHDPDLSMRIAAGKAINRIRNRQE